jgi:hypothetical protein
MSALGQKRTYAVRDAEAHYPKSVGQTSVVRELLRERIG